MVHVLVYQESPRQVVAGPRWLGSSRAHSLIRLEQPLRRPRAAYLRCRISPRRCNWVLMLRSLLVAIHRPTASVCGLQRWRVARIATVSKCSLTRLAPRQTIMAWTLQLAPLARIAGVIAARIRLRTRRLM